MIRELRLVIGRRKAGLLLRVAGIASAIAALMLTPQYGLVPLFVGLITAISCLVPAGFLLSKDEVSRLSKTEGAKQISPYVTPYEVFADEIGVRVIYKGLLDSHISWNDLAHVAIKIDDSFLPQPWWWLLDSKMKGCQFPQEAKGALGILEALQARLPDLDNRSIIEAMGLMDGGKLVWSRETDPEETPSAPNNSLQARRP